MTDFRAILDTFLNAASGNIQKYATRQLTLNLPFIPIETAVEICEAASKVFQSEPVLLELQSPQTVIGDIHGHVLDLFRILNIFGLPPRRKFLFLGDIVDRGEFSVETVLIVFLLKVLFPLDVHIIRGNHEFLFLNQECGMMAQSVDVYGDVRMYQACVKAFSFMPMSARIDSKILCVHGGIGPDVKSISQLRIIGRPLNHFGDRVVDSVLWSDPSDDCETFAPSVRGTGYMFGAVALKEFLEHCQVDLVIRAHECVMSGVDWMFDRHLVTVFSASNYCGCSNNESGILEVLPGWKFHEHRFPPLDYLLRRHVVFRRKRNGVSGLEKVKRLGSYTSPSKMTKEMKPLSCSNLPRLSMEAHTARVVIENATPLPALNPRGGFSGTGDAAAMKLRMATAAQKRRVTCQ